MQNHIQKNHSAVSTFAYPPSAHGINNKSEDDLKNLRKIRNTNHSSACLLPKPSSKASFVLRAKLTLNLKLSPEKKVLGQGIGGGGLGG